MKYKITKLYSGNIEFVYGDNVVMLTELTPSVILTRNEYRAIPEHKKYLIDNQFVAVDYIDEEVKEVKIEIKK